LKLRHQFYIFQILLSSILFLFLGLTYNSYQNQYKKDIDVHIQNELNLHKKEILSSMSNATKKLQKQKNTFISIHKNTLEVLKKNPNLDLEELKNKIKSKYLTSTVDVELYLIDKSYTIYKTTYPKDVGFNLSVVTEAKEYLDKTSKDGKVYISDFVSTDALDMKYKLYSYSKLKDDVYLEMGFVDNTLTNTMELLLRENTNSLTKVNLYSVSKDKQQYYYYHMKKNDNGKSKEEQYKEFMKFDLNEKTDDKIINTIKSDVPIHLMDNNIHTIYSKVFNKNMYTVLGFEDIVIKIDVDVSDKLKFIKNIKNIFITSILIISILLIVLFLFIRNRFTNPIENILNSLSNQEKVESNTILSLNNELTDISNKYNSLFNNLNLEIDKNKFLLNENKQFISDTVHQIRTPLTNIMMNGDMIKLYKKDESLSSFIDQINGSINMLNNSYEDLSYIMTYDSIEYNPSLFSLSDTLTNRVKFFETISKVNRKEIESQINPNINFTINQIELERLIDNNISNGIKYAEINKPITITLTNDNEIVTLSFKTFGKPIQNTSKLFDKNYRENNGKRGLGLGLFMVKNICEKYDISYDISYKDNQNIFTYIFRLTLEI